MSKKQFLNNQSQEQEAYDIGSKFMNSNDVLKDMGNAYGVNLKSHVKIHDDEDSYEQLEDREEDAYSQGNDIFFGRGVLNNSPASKGLLAHETTHVMQTQGLGGFSSVGSPSVAQGGLLSKIFGFFSGSSSTEPSTASSKTKIPKKQDYEYNNAENAFMDKYSGTIEGIEGEDMNAFQKAVAVPEMTGKSNGSIGGNLKTLFFKMFSSTITGSLAQTINSGGNANALKRNWLYRGLHGIGSGISAVGRGIFNLGKLGLGKITGNKKWSENASRYLQTGFLKNLFTGAGTLGGGFGGALGGAALGTMLFPGIGTLIGAIAGGALGTGLGHGLGRKAGQGLQTLTYNKGNDSISKRAEQEFIENNDYLNMLKEQKEKDNIYPQFEDSNF